MESPDTVSIWNRAAMRDRHHALRAGDVALAALLFAHGHIMNGGVLHAVEMLDPEELAEAIKGYEFFGFLRVHEILMRASKLLADASADLESAESVFDSEYHAIIEDDSTIGSAFERHLATNSQDFAPVR
jgi:hypothetical protein